MVMVSTFFVQYSCRIFSINFCLRLAQQRWMSCEWQHLITVTMSESTKEVQINICTKEKRRGERGAEGGSLQLHLVNCKLYWLWPVVIFRLQIGPREAKQKKTVIEATRSLQWYLLLNIYWTEILLSKKLWLFVFVIFIDRPQNVTYSFNFLLATVTHNFWALKQTR